LSHVKEEISNLNSIILINTIFTSSVYAAQVKEVYKNEYFAHTMWHPDYGLRRFENQLTYVGDEYENDSGTYQMVINHDFIATAYIMYNPEIGNGDIILQSIKLIDSYGNTKDQITSFSNGTIRSYLYPPRSLLEAKRSYTTLWGQPVGSYRIKTTSLFIHWTIATDEMYSSTF